MKVIVLVLALASGAFGETGFLAQQAQLAWQDRDKPGQTEQAIGLWEQALRAEPGRADLWVDLAKARGRAVRHARTSRERRQWADQALAAAEKAVAKDASSSDAFAFYGEALGQWAQAHKGVHDLIVIKQAVTALNQAVKLNPKNAYAHMLLSSFYRQAPSLISVGNKEKALEEAKLAVDSGPGYAINHLVLARALLEHGQKEEAIQHLQILLALSPPADAVPETRADQTTAAAMLHDLGFAAPACGESGGYCAEQKQP